MPERPEPYMKGMIPTLNHRGFMLERLDLYSQQFVDYAGTVDSEVLDIGCAYGNATQAALKNGARVLACDMDEGHLQIVIRETADDMRDRLRTEVGVLPDVDFSTESLGAILCSRVLHFLLSAEIRESLQKMHRWLIPGGRLFLVADSPYTGFWFSKAPEYERRKAQGDEWPGLIEDVGPFFENGQIPDGMLPFMNSLDPDILSRECRRAGFVVEKAEFFGRDMRSEGRDHAGIIARKPIDGVDN